MTDNKHLTIKDVFEKSKTETGKEELKETFKRKLENDADFKNQTAGYFESIISFYQETEAVINKLVELPDDKINELAEYIFGLITTSEDLTESEKDEIIKQWQKKPHYMIALLIKASKVLFDEEIDLTSVRKIKVAGSNKKPTTIKMQVKSPILIGDLMPPNLTPFDGEVFNAICTLLYYGTNVVTLRQIAEAMAGKQMRSKAALERIEDSIRKMQTTMLFLDWTEHAKLIPELKDKGLKECISEETIIKPSVMKLTFKNNQEIKVFSFEKGKFPPLFEYALKVGQVCMPGKKAYLIPTISNTEENIVIKNYLIRQVEQIKNNKNNKNKRWNNIITYDTLFSNCSIKTQPKHLPLKRKVVTDILDYWREIKYIKKYEIIKKGRMYYAIKINV